ncbi:MAG: putative transporter [Candidatus Cryptobacteroides sp.]|nr:putative transporter [Candidatus Cryptobacteroides sp.]
MDWFTDLFTKQTFIQAIIVLSLICAVGLACNKIKFKGISLGVTFVFFAGILAGHLGLRIDPQMLLLAQNFGLILFVYSLGLQVGPSFFPSLKKGGLKLNLLSFAVLVTGTFLSVCTFWLTDIPFPISLGLLSGAVTNTPMLGAAQQALIDAHPDAIPTSNAMAMACAVGYPFGVIGVILCVVILRAVFQKKEERKESHDNPTYVAEFEVSNPAIFGKCIKDIMGDVKFHLVVSRVWKYSVRDEKSHIGVVIIPNGDTVLEEGEHVLVLCKEAEKGMAEKLFGRAVKKDWNKKDIDWNVIDGQLVSRHVLVTKEKVNGAKLGDLHLRNTYGINITRVNRAGIDILPSSSLRLQMGDKLTIVGQARAIDNVAQVLGNQEKELRTPNLFSIFTGIILGLILGSIPLFLPGISAPIKLGIAGGPIIVGIIMGAFGPRLHIPTYTTHSANLMLRQFGLTVYLAGLGLSAGPGFFETVMRPEGLEWIGISLAMVLVPVLTVGFIAGKFCKLDYSSNVGMLCGIMANPIALNYALSTVDDDNPSVAYATVYPAGIFLRVISAQLLILLLC